MPPQDDLVTLVKQLQSKLDKLEVEVSHLRKENKQLRAENKQLRAENKQLRAENKKLNKRVEELENRLRLFDGPNSPSSTIPVYLKDLKTNSAQDVQEDDKKSSSEASKASEASEVSDDKSTTASKKKRGRKEGHKGVTTVRPADRKEDLKVEECGNCHISLIDEEQVKIFGFKKLQIKITTEMVDYTAYKVSCYNCDHTNQTGPENKGTIFGSSALSLIGTLWYDCRVPLNRISQFISSITEDNYAETAIIHGINAISEKLGPIAIEYKQQVFESKYVGIDETGYTVAINGRKLNWIWAFSTDDAVFYEFRDTRGKIELEEVWEPPPENVIPVVDGWKPYSYFPAIQRCWSHVLRVVEDVGKRCIAGKTLSDQLHKLYHDIKTFRRLRPEIGSMKLRELALKRINGMIAEAKGDADNTICKKLTKFLVTLVNAKSDLLTAIEHPGLWLTNNISERNLRKFVVHRKIRGYVASEKGKKALTNFATVFESLRTQGKHIYPSLKDILCSAG